MMDMITTIVRDGEKEKKLEGSENRKRNDDSECEVGEGAYSFSCTTIETPMERTTSGICMAAEE
jgi:hypothetical protein